MTQSIQSFTVTGTTAGAHNGFGTWESFPYQATFVASAIGVTPGRLNSLPPSQQTSLADLTAKQKEKSVANSPPISMKPHASTRHQQP
jgi:hypothetical protein